MEDVSLQSVNYCCFVDCVALDEYRMLAEDGEIEKMVKSEPNVKIMHNSLCK